MSRRRMMMQMLSQKVDLLDGYRIDNLSNAYKIQIWWLDDNTIEFKHASAGFMGPSSAAKNFIGTTASASTGAGGALLQTPPISTLEVGKEYKLTLTVIEIVNNTATAENDGLIELAFGRGGGDTDKFFTSVKINFSDIQVGQKLEVIKSYQSANYATTSAAITVNNPNLIWDIKFNVKLEEV